MERLNGGRQIPMSKNRKSWPWVAAFMAALRTSSLTEYDRANRVANEVVGPEHDEEPLEATDIERRRQQLADQAELVSALQSENRELMKAQMVCTEAFECLCAGTEIEPLAVQDIGDRAAWERLAEVKATEMEAVVRDLGAEIRKADLAADEIATLRELNTFANDKAETLERLQAERNAEHVAALHAVQDSLSALHTKYRNAVPEADLLALIDNWTDRRTSFGSSLSKNATSKYAAVEECETELAALMLRNRPAPELHSLPGGAALFPVEVPS